VQFVATGLADAFEELRTQRQAVVSKAAQYQPGKKEAWLAAIHKDNLEWTQVSDLKFWDNEVAVLYGIKAIPSNLLLDKDGKIIAKDLRGVELDKKLVELLGN